MQTLLSDSKINILNPNLNVKMFNKGVETNVENIFSVPFPPNKLKDALMSSQYLEGINNYWRECIVDIIFKNNSFFS